MAWACRFQSLSGPGSPGVGVHRQFAGNLQAGTGTQCGISVFFVGTDFGPTFRRILQLAILLGRWEVKVGDWTWIYEFKAGTDPDSGSAQWQKFQVVSPSSDQGTGTWALDSTTSKLRITWSNGSVEEWNTPLTTSGQVGRLIKYVGPIQPSEDKRAIAARRID